MFSKKQKIILDLNNAFSVKTKPADLFNIKKKKLILGYKRTYV